MAAESTSSSQFELVLLTFFWSITVRCWIASVVGVGVVSAIAAADDVTVKRNHAGGERTHRPKIDAAH